MLRSCAYCGFVHDKSFVCSKKPKRDYADREPTHIHRFRWTALWKNKTKEIRDRDKHLCQICLKKRYDTTYQYNFRDLEIHHIYPLVSHFYKRLDNDNLITLCKYHHSLADNSIIPRKELLEIVKELEIPHFAEKEDKNEQNT